ncbi:MAG: DUF2203 family protein [Candidatus Diapherotrites archaeon]|uniref:DUF2203 family protein n=1 Tax=Candidatus Iainarchaeum sp. TaxID=3101447 RepID=A0A8T4C5W3_9ARCH|nr:DUF2203 family protein [Candidatus Diapherotrites archaeon]
MAHRYFTLTEAEALLPKVKLHMDKLMNLHDELSALSGVKLHAEELDWKTHLLAININKRYHELSFKYFAELEALTHLGCYVKDVGQGLVDFYSKLDQKDVLLCWQYDEPTILYYHDESTGKSGRIPIHVLKEKLAAQTKTLL